MKKGIYELGFSFQNDLDYGVSGAVVKPLELDASLACQRRYHADAYLYAHTHTHSHRYPDALANAHKFAYADVDAGYPYTAAANAHRRSRDPRTRTAAFTDARVAGGDAHACSTAAGIREGGVYNTVMGIRVSAGSGI